jgi:hypothetical protein
MYNVDSFVIVIIHLELWDASKERGKVLGAKYENTHIEMIHHYLQPPPRFPNFSQIIFSTENCSFLEAAALAARQAPAAWTIEFDQLRLGSRSPDCHIKRVMWRAAASARKRELFFRHSNLLPSDIVFEVRFGDAAQTFLAPTATVMTNFHSVAVRQLRLHSVGSAVHLFSHVCFSFLLRFETGKGDQPFGFLDECKLLG